MQFAPVEPVNAVVPPTLLPIDPRKAPVVGGPDGLPAVAPAQLTPDAVLAIKPVDAAEAFEVPLAWLMDPANHRRHAVSATDGVRRTWYSMPYVDGPHERFVWGATAGMLRNLYRFLAA